MPANSLPRRFYRKYHKSLFFLITVAFLIFTFYLFVNFFRIRNIIIKNQSTLPILGLEEIKESNYFLFNENYFETRLKELNPLINKITIDKKFPNLVEIDFVEYVPAIAIQGNVKYLLLSDDGRILQKTNQLLQNIPLIHFYQKINEQTFNVGDRLTYGDIIAALYYQKSLYEMGLKTDSIDIVGFDMIVCKVGGQEFVFSTQINKEKAIYEVGEIVKKFKIEGREYKKIDLRYDKPIVSF
jgi:cell division septal protein FtsQ